MLIVFGGLPGTGKSTIAQHLARKLSAVYLRIDSMEQALIRSGINLADMGPAGYVTGYAVATDNLRLGLTVVADSVNPLDITRQAWSNVAREVGVRCMEIELICSDQAEHRLRIESRSADIPGHQLPNWQNVIEREYEAWNSEHLIVDTSTTSVVHAVEAIFRNLDMPSQEIQPR